MRCIGAFELEAVAQKGVAATGIEQIARAELLHATICRACLQHRVLAVEGDLLHADLLACIHAHRTRTLEQHMVELRTRHLEGEIGLGIERVRKTERVVAAAVVGEIRPTLQHADATHVFQHAEAFKNRHVHRQQGFADMKARVLRLLKQGNGPTELGKCDGRGAASRAAADDQDIRTLRSGSRPGCRHGGRGEANSGGSHPGTNLRRASVMQS